MWFILDDALANTDLTSTESRSGLEQILYAVAKGEHAIAGSAMVIKAIVDKVAMSPVPQGVLRTIFNKSPTILDGANKAPFRIRIIAGVQEPMRGSEGEWAISLAWVADHGVPLSHVLAEDIVDAELYIHCAWHYAAFTRTGMKVSLHPLNGGGTRTCEVQKSEIARMKNFVLCVTDSDKSCPTAPLSRTSKDCASAAKESVFPTLHICLEEREIENLIPYNLIYDAIGELSSDHVRRLDDIGQFVPSNDVHWKFLDLKEGTSLTVLFHDVSREFWRTLVNNVKNTATSIAHCLSKSACFPSSGTKCNCYITPPLSPNIAVTVLNYVKVRGHHNNAKRASTSGNFSRWQDVGASLSAWGAAMPKQRS